MDKKTLEGLAKEYVEANDAYERLMAEFVASGPVVEGMSLPMPKRLLTSAGLVELDAAWARVESAQKVLHKAMIEYTRNQDQ